MSTPQSNRISSNTSSFSDMSLLGSPSGNSGLSFLHGSFLTRSSSPSPINLTAAASSQTAQDPTRDDPELPVSELSRNRLLTRASQMNLTRPDHVSFDVPHAVFDNLNFPDQPIGSDFLPIGEMFPINQGSQEANMIPNLQVGESEGLSETTPITQGLSRQSELTGELLGVRIDEPGEGDNTQSQSPPVTEAPSLSFNPPTILLEGVESDDEDYPLPADVVAEVYLVASLDSSEMMTELRSIRYSEARRLGYMRLTLRNTQLEVSPYSQVVLAYAMRFYSTLPDIGYSLQTLQLLHYYYRTNFVRPPGEPMPEIAPYYQDISGYALDSLIVLTARAFIDAAAGNSAELLAAESVSALFSHIDYMRSNAPFLFVIYNILGHVIHGGVACIQPIPKILMYDPGMSRYVEGIATGTEDIFSLTVAIQPRDPTLPHAPYQVKAVPPAQDVPESSSRRPPQTTRAPSMFTAPGTIPAPPVRTPVVDPASSDLLSQGDVGRVQVLRDTSAFRQAVENNVEIQSVLSQIITRLDTYDLKLTQLQQDVRRLDQGLALHMTQTSQEDLAQRYSVNQSLLTTQTHAAAALIERAPAGPQPVGQSLARVISRLETFPGNGISPSHLVSEVKEVLALTPHEGLSININEAALLRVNTRLRLISTLKQIPQT